MRATPLSIGDRLLELDLTNEDGKQVHLASMNSAASSVLYFMRTSACPVCHAHLRQIERDSSQPSIAERVVVIVPGGPADAASVARRHPYLAGRVVASSTAHTAVGLFVRAGLQQSGTFVVSREGAVLAARFSTIPTGSFDEAEVQAAIAAVEERAPSA